MSTTTSVMKSHATGSNQAIEPDINHTISKTPSPDHLPTSPYLPSPTHSSFRTPSRDEILKSFCRARKRILFLDYDGTLVPIRENPSECIPSPKLLTHLHSISTLAHTILYIVSGRDRHFLTTQFSSVPQIGLVAEHGTFIQHPGSHTWIDRRKQGHDQSWRDLTHTRFSSAVRSHPNSWIEVKEAATVFHYRECAFQHLAIKEVERMQGELSREFARLGLEMDVIRGKCNLEVKPAYLNKGAVVRELCAGMGVEEHKAGGMGVEGDMDEGKRGNMDRDGIEWFILAAGDDTTDESMFHTLDGLPEHIQTATIHVRGSDEAGGVESIARYQMSNPDEMVTLLGGLATA